MKYNTITKQVAETVPGGVYEGVDYHGTPPEDVAARAGWVDVTPEIQAEIDAAAAIKAEADAAEAAQNALIAAMPAQFPTGVAVPIPDAEGHFMLLQPTADGAAVIAIQISDSPIDAAAWKARKDAALARIAAQKATLAADLDTKRTASIKNAAAAQNVPQIRAALADMQAQIDALRAIVEAR
jgi:hypothetical protein